MIVVLIIARHNNLSSSADAPTYLVFVDRPRSKEDTAKMVPEQHCYDSRVMVEYGSAATFGSLIPEIHTYIIGT